MHRLDWLVRLGSIRGSVAPEVSAMIGRTPLKVLRRPSARSRALTRLAGINAESVALAEQWPDVPIEQVIAAAGYCHAFVFGSSDSDKEPVGIMAWSSQEQRDCLEK